MSGYRWLVLAALVGCSLDDSIGSGVEPAPADHSCFAWSEPLEVGSLDPEAFDEASGLDFSIQFADRMYHISDGDDSRLYVSDHSGNIQQTVSIAGFTASDVEDLTVGRCGKETWCVFIADIGDNAEKREWVEIVIVEEVENFGKEVTAVERVRFRYPDGPNDAEAFAIHPDGDLYIMARKWSLADRRIDPTPIFKLARDQWRNHNGEIQIAERVGTIDFTQLGALGFPDGVASAMDIADNGQSVLVLTYLGAFELFKDLSRDRVETDGLRQGSDYRRIELQPLEQQEAAAWVPGENAFVYGTEYTTRVTIGPPPSGRARLMRIDCIDPRRRVS